jgi:NitT/TauT family transport system ATP-binding protein
MKNDMVTVSHLKKTFDSQLVIDDLTFSIPCGTRTAVFAPSGAGKTTLIQILAGLQKPDGGMVQVNVEHPVILFQEPRLFPYMTVEENIFLPFKLQDKPVLDHNRDDFEAWISVCGLGDFRRHYPYQLSGGMKQKVSLIRGLIQKPSLVLMDEPFQSIGRQAKLEIINYLLKANPDVTILLVTHDPEEVELLAHHMLYFPTSILGHYAFIQTNDQKFQTFRRSGMELPETDPGQASLIHA